MTSPWAKQKQQEKDAIREALKLRPLTDSNSKAFAAHAAARMLVAQRMAWLRRELEKWTAAQKAEAEKKAAEEATP